MVLVEEYTADERVERVRTVISCVQHSCGGRGGGGDVPGNLIVILHFKKNPKILKAIERLLDQILRPPLKGRAARRTRPFNNLLIQLKSPDVVSCFLSCR